jgi:hypothetical protein
VPSTDDDASESTTNSKSKKKKAKAAKKQKKIESVAEEVPSTDGDGIPNHNTYS